MLSRVANNMYWASRYLERVENTARLINVHGHLLMDLPGRNAALGWQPLLDITGAGEAFFQRHRAANEANVVNFLLSDDDNPGAIMTSLQQARENLRSTRDAIPREAWEQVNDLYLWTKQRLSDGIKRRQRYDFLSQIIRQNQLITGLLHGTMSHDDAYNFMRIGCYLERADMTSRILDVRSANLLSDAADLDLTPLDNIQWMSVLKSLTGYQMYRRHVRLQVLGPDVLNFLLRNDQFPRSFLYCLERAGFCLRTLPQNQTPLRRLHKVRRLVHDADVKALAESGLYTFIDQLQLGLADVSGAINAAYFDKNQVRLQSQIQSDNSQQHQSSGPQRPHDRTRRARARSKSSAMR